MPAWCSPLPVPTRAGLTGPLITNLAVITEVVYMLDFAAQAQRDFLLWAESALVLETETVSDLPADFADASLVALCERRRIGGGSLELPASIPPSLSTGCRIDAVLASFSRARLSRS